MVYWGNRFNTVAPALPSSSGPSSFHKVNWTEADVGHSVILVCFSRWHRCRVFKYILLTVPRRCFFCGLFLLVMLHVGVCCAVVFAPCSLVVTCWERADLLAVMFVVFVTFPNVSCSTSELRVRLAPWNWFKPSSKIFDWPFQLWIFYAFFLSCVSYAFVRVCLYVPCGHLWGKGRPLGSRLWCLTVSLSLFHWYPGSCVVLACIDSWYLHPYLFLLLAVAPRHSYTRVFF